VKRCEGCKALANETRRLGTRLFDANTRIRELERERDEARAALASSPHDEREPFLDAMRCAKFLVGYASELGADYTRVRIGDVGVVLVGLGKVATQLDGVASALEKDEDFDTLVLRDMQVEVED